MEENSNVDYIKTVGFILTGLAGILYTSVVLGSNGVIYLSIFIMILLLGVATTIKNERYSRFLLFAISCLAFLTGVSRATAARWTNPLSVALLLLSFAMAIEMYKD